MSPKIFAAFGLLTLIGCTDKSESTDTSEGVTETADTTEETDTETVGTTDTTLTTETGETGTTDTVTDTGPTGPTSEDVFEAMITVTESIGGDQSCFRPGGACATQRAEESCIASMDVDGTVVDFQTGDRVANATVTVSPNDIWDEEVIDLGGTEGTGEFDGGTLQSCTQQYWHLDDDGTTSDYVQTEYAHYTLVPGEGSVAMPMVSALTVDAIYSLFGVKIEDSTGIISGTLTDCAGAPLAGAQVIMGSDGGYSYGQSGHYFVDGVPSPEQLSTSDDGQWLLLNALGRDVSVEFWGRIDGIDEPLLMAYTDVVVRSGGITFVDMRLGYCGGLLPDECLEPCD